MHPTSQSLLHKNIYATYGEYKQKLDLCSYTMPPEDYLSDDFVASLLSKDAKDGTIKYSACGLQGLLPKRSVYRLVVQ